MYTYLFLQYLLLIFAIFAGYNISKNKHSKIWSIILIVLFTFVEGSRFGRGIDYNVYADAWVWEYAQPPLIFETFLFRLLCKLIFLYWIAISNINISNKFYSYTRRNKISEKL